MDETALRANRQGHMTPEQEKALIDASTHSGWLGCGMAAVIMALILLVAENFFQQAPVIGIIILMADLIGSMLLASRIMSFPIRRKLARGIGVEQAVGEVVWRGSHYLAESNGRTLRPLGGSLNLAPGHYQFYTIAGTNWLLSAEQPGAAAQQQTASPSAGLDRLRTLLDQPINFDPRQSPELAAARIREFQGAWEQVNNSSDPVAQAEAAELARRAADRMKNLARGLKAGDVLELGRLVQQPTPPALDGEGLGELRRALAQTNHFTDRDLERNREGRLSGRQRRAMLGDFWRNLLLTLVLWALSIGITAVSVIKHDKDPLGTLAAALFLVLIGSFFLASSYSDLMDFLYGRAEYAVGSGDKYTRTSHSSRSGHTHYYYRIDTMSFEVSIPAYNALVTGLDYRLYYAPRTLRLLSIEPKGAV
jgi:FtsH-binding integral membrane protein